jgi:hypothetical protein
MRGIGWRESWKLTTATSGARKAGGNGAGKAKVITAVSLNKKGRSGYVKMAVSDDLASKSLAAFAEKNIAAGSTISNSAYLKAFSSGTYTHKPKKFDAKGDKNHLKWLHTIVSNVSGPTVRHLSSGPIMGWTQRIFRRTWTNSVSA